MANVLDATQRAEAERLYAVCQDLQTQLWEASLELEKIIGCAVDTTEDLTDGASLDSFIQWDREV